MYRVEDKYFCGERDLFLLEKRIASFLQTDINQKDGIGYVVTSLYFDDVADSDYQDAVNGNARREKYRLRIYNDSCEAIKLEVKQKLYNRVKKKSQLITLEQAKKLIAGEILDEEVVRKGDAAEAFNLAVRVRGLRPRLLVSYDRSAYVYPVGNVRITFDRKIRFSKEVESFGEKSPFYIFERQEESVLEVKYDEVLPNFIVQLLELGNMYQTAYSKYKIGREKEYVSERYN